MFDRDTPFNDLPPLPPTTEVETPAVLKKAIAASRALAELKGMAERMPNQVMLIDSLVLQEARASSAIENIVTTNDELFRAASDEALPASPEAKEVLRYRQALNHGFRQIRERPLATNLFIEIAQLIKQTGFDVRRTPGTRIANGFGETIYTPPESEAVIRDKLRDLETFMHAEDSLDVLVKMALVHYQFEAIHPFSDGNGRTGRILNILYLVDQGLLNLPILYLSRHIIEHKAAYYEGLRRVTEEAAWGDWVLYMLNAVEQTSLRTRQQITDILALMDAVREHVQREAPRLYSKDLIEQIFRQPYCKIQFLERAGIGTRQTCAKYLRELERLGVLRGQKVGREVYFINQALFELLTR
ncbi:Fic family protein [Accumulibacter sp.]|uniref:Fic family protein n=1 Tax=Accumulibacter sp. TaxID=2053492 RepID=UPI002600BA58|nr:Fic family protein [Accumulibacter sp.]MCM8596142.1 Fic family protein [Accumulibacter sp.]MCM8625576.1 Fic family protein [Accumulibacter sp.]MDS4050291.1 Fic family protein [Accumulibacter sp.]